MKESEKGIIYQSIVAMGMRSRQINDDIKNEISERMADIISDPNDADGTNFDQIAISREFDNISKPTFLAMQEILDEKINYDLPEQEKEEEEKK
jgi:DNA-directed RNA polymerase subunit K/omega